MGSHPIVIVNGLVYLLSGLSEVHPLTLIQPSVLHSVVHPLCQRIVQRISRLRHADARMVVKQYPRILLAGILDAPVGVVYYPFGVYPPVPIEVQSHLQGFQRSLTRECGVQGIANDGAAVSVRQQGEVGETIGYGDIGDVGHQEAAVGLGNVLGIGVEQVIIYTVRMAGVGGMGTVALSLEHQSVGTQDVKEAVTAEDELLTEEFTAQMV